MEFINKQNLLAANLQHFPYEHIVIKEFINPDVLDIVTRDFPRITKTGLFPLSSSNGGLVFKNFVKELDGEDFESIIADIFSTQLRGKPKLFTMRGRCHINDGSIHTDSISKIITILIYLNSGWEEDGGRLRILKSGTDISDFTEEISPKAGTLLAFRRSDKSFHGHEPFEGERKSIQINWMTSTSAHKRELTRHRFSSFLKQVNPFG